MVKHSKLIFGIIAILGAVFVTLFSTFVYWLNMWSVESLELEALMPPTDLTNLMTFFLIGGIAFLTIGILGIGRQLVKNRKSLFTVLALILVPLLTFTCVVSADSMREFPPPERMAITNFSVDSINPLTFSFNAKSFYSHTILFDKVFVKENQTIVAQINSKLIEVNDSSGHPYYRTKFLGELPPVSEKSFTFDFNTTLPSGSYNFGISSWRQGGFISFSFTVP